MKENNVRLIMDIILRMGPISRSRLTEMVGLTQVSVINITNELLEAGVLEQVGMTNDSTQGRKACVIDVKADSFFSYCLVLRVEEMVLGIIDLRGNVINSVSIAYPAKLKPEQLLSTVETMSEKMLSQYQIPEEKILGMGIAAPGPLDVQNGILVDPPNFPHLRNFNFREKLEERFKVPVCLDKETNLAALAEYYYGNAKNYKTSFFISIFNLGIGGGMVSDGKVFHGFCDGAGEIGHMTVEPSGCKCGCGNYGCLEAMISENNVVSEVKHMLKIGVGNMTDDDIDNITFEEVFARSHTPGINAYRIAVEKMSSYLSLAIGNIINVYSPELITIGGAVPEMDEAFVEIVAEKVHKRSYPSHCKNIVLKKSELGNDVFLKGAAALVQQKFLTTIFS